MNRLKLLFPSVAAVLLSLAGLHASAGTVVRFHIQYGTTPFGDVDVDLFDQDKPLTVSNFLANVGSGLYDNSILHDLRPGFTVQGGAAHVANPYSNEPFEIVTRIPTNAPVPNEFGVGALRSNVLGTLAMAKNPGDTNSSSASWFFNLANNNDGFGVTNLDAAASLGGYTVFGQVKSGLSVLTFLNSFTLEGGVQNMTNDFHTLFCPPLHLYPDDMEIGFDALPVGFYGVDCIRYSDLFNVQVYVLDSPDRVPPKLTVVFPPAAPGGPVTVAGAATDNVGVETVRVYVNTNGPLTATGTGVWSAVMTGLVPGTNSVVVEAIDTTGNRTQVARSYFYSVPVAFTLGQIGQGTVTGPANGALLELGRGYKLVAKPASGYLFAGWTGSTYESSATLPFLMQSNFNVTAVFVTNAFPSVKGTYNGLFYTAGQVEQDSSGYLTLTLGNLGAYSAKVLMNNQKFKLSGHFSPDGGETNLLFRAGTNALLVRMLLDVAHGTDHLTGSVTNNQITAIDTNAAWFATLKADRAAFTSANPSPVAGNYTVILPPDPVASGPDGSGFGRVKVSSKGAVSFSGTLADGTKAVQKTTVSKTGAWPMYLPLYKDKGALVSWVMFDSAPLSTDLSGLVNWFKQSQPTATLYPRGFTNESTLVGARYTPPASGSRIINLPNASIGFTNGNLAVNFANAITIGTDNKVANLGANVLSLKLQTSSGLFSGTVTPPGGGEAMPFKGAILQKQPRGAGFLLGPDLCSGVSLGAP